MNIDLYMGSAAKRACSTCAYWTGTRATESDGYVYSIDGLQGICTAPGSAAGLGVGTVRLTEPGDGCGEWVKWRELEIDEVA